MSDALRQKATLWLADQWPGVIVPASVLESLAELLVASDAEAAARRDVAWAHGMVHYGKLPPPIEECIAFVKRVAYEPIGHAEASDREILDTLTEEARALFARSTEYERVTAPPSPAGEPAPERETSDDLELMALASKAIEAFQGIAWMAREYAEGGGSGGPEMRDFDEWEAQIKDIEAKVVARARRTGAQT